MSSSSSLAIAQLILDASQKYTIYVSFIILFAGVFGHLIDVLVFTSSKQFRNNQSAFYLTAESIFNCIQLLISFSSRIAINGFGNDLTRTSLFWCKLRNTIAGTITPLSFNIVCWAAIDQYLSTSYHPFLKRLSTIRLAHWLTLIAVIIWTLHGIPFIVMMEIHPTIGCYTSNVSFTTYVSYVYYLIFTSSLPIVVSTSFAALAYHNVRRIVRRQIAIFRRRLEKQLTAMILVRVAFLAILTIPFVVYRIYVMQVKIDSTSYIHLAIVQLLGSIVYSLFYLNFAGSFYLFWLSSVRFRRQVKFLLVKKYWRQFCRGSSRENRVAPVSHISSVEMD